VKKRQQVCRSNVLRVTGMRCMPGRVLQSMKCTAVQAPKLVQRMGLSEAWRCSHAHASVVHGAVLCLHSSVTCIAGRASEWRRGCFSNIACARGTC